MKKPKKYAIEQKLTIMSGPDLKGNTDVWLILSGKTDLRVRLGSFGRDEIANQFVKDLKLSKQKEDEHDKY